MENQERQQSEELGRNYPANQLHPTNDPTTKLRKTLLGPTDKSSPVNFPDKERVDTDRLIHPIHSAKLTPFRVERHSRSWIKSELFGLGMDKTQFVQRN